MTTITGLSSSVPIICPMAGTPATEPRTSSIPPATLPSRLTDLLPAIRAVPWGARPGPRRPMLALRLAVGLADHPGGRADIPELPAPPLSQREVQNQRDGDDRDHLPAELGSKT